MVATVTTDCSSCCHWWLGLSFFENGLCGTSLSGPVVRTSFPLQVAGVQSPIKEQRSCMPHGVAKKKRTDFVHSLLPWDPWPPDRIICQHSLPSSHWKGSTFSVSTHWSTHLSYLSSRKIIWCHHLHHHNSLLHHQEKNWLQTQLMAWISSKYSFKIII